MLNTKTNSATKTLVEKSEVTNPNLIINSNFKINQRSKSEYTSNGYTVDRWATWNCNVKKIDSGITATFNSNGSLTYTFENSTNETCTATFKITKITGKVYLYNSDKAKMISEPGIYSITNNKISTVSLYKSDKDCGTDSVEVTIEWVKLERGSIATPYVEPDPVTEFLKCCRYYQRTYIVYNFYGIATQAYYYQIHLDTKLRIYPTLDSDIKYKYNISEIGLYDMSLDNKPIVYLVVKAGSSNSSSIEGLVEMDAEIY